MQANAPSLISINRELKNSDNFHALSNEVLTVLLSDINLKDMIENVIDIIQDYTRIAAVGIRLKDGDDFPYFAQHGFSQNFLRTENTLIETTKDNKICVDEFGNARLGCTCGLVISGAIDTTNPFFTKAGSFITNNSLPILDLKESEDPRFRPRNVCIHHGFSSVAIIPIRAHGKIIGTLQLNDKKTNAFQVEMIDFFENLSLSIGIAIMRKQAEILIEEKNEELKRLNFEKDKFFSIIAHDLKSPFNSVLGIVDLLKDSIEEKNFEEAKEFTDMIVVATNKATSLLKNLLEWSRSQTGNIVFNPNVFDLSGLVTEVSTLYATIAEQKKIEVTCKFAPNIMILADKEMIATVLRNLISNAIKFTCCGGKIIIIVEKISHNITVKVCDSGIGIPKASIEKLFKITNKYSTPGTQNEQGTGLGLILCKDFIDKHKGRIWVKSEEGNGSNFIFTIPYE